MRSAAILAGGKASRFGGQNKAALVVDGRPILDRLVAELAAVDGLAEIAIVGGTAIHPGARSIADLVADCGPLGGIHAALSVLTREAGDAVLVVACDMPYVTRAFVTELFDRVENVDIVVPQTPRGYHPLCAVYTRACLEAIARRLAERRLKVTDLFADVRTRVVVPADDVDDVRGHELLANVNTPGEFAALHGHNKP